jgi:hypothetical protein
MTKFLHPEKEPRWRNEAGNYQYIYRSRPEKDIDGEHVICADNAPPKTDLLVVSTKQTLSASHAPLVQVQSENTTQPAQQIETPRPSVNETHSPTTAPSLNREITVPPLPSTTVISHNSSNDMDHANSKSIAVSNFLDGLASILKYFIGDESRSEMYIIGLVFVICFACLMLVVFSRWKRLARVCPFCSVAFCNCLPSPGEIVRNVISSVNRISSRRLIVGLILFLFPVLIVLYWFLHRED